MNWGAAILERGADPRAVVLAAGAMALAFVLLLLFALLDSRHQNQQRRRIARVKAAPQRVAGMPAVSVKRSTSDSSIVAFDRLIKRVLPNPARMRERLERTGRKISLGQYLFACLAVGIAGTATTIVVFDLAIAPAVLFGIVVGAGLPHLVVGYLGRRRLDTFIALFPEAIDLIVRGLKSGLPITESVKVVGTEIADPVGTEFQRISDSIKFGMTMTEALWVAAPRLDTPEYRFFVISLSIQQETGGNLAETLENLSNVLRRRRQMKLKIKAFSSEAKASAYIIGSLPFLMQGIIMMMNYGYAIVLFTDPRGVAMIGVGLLSFAMGAGIMYKMVKFEI